MDNTLEKALVKATRRSTHSRYQTGCIIVNRRGKIVSDGCSHSSDRTLKELRSIHAEIHALGRGRHIDLTNCVAYVVTMARKSRNLVNSAPCYTCAIAMKSAGIEEVIYTLNNDNYKRINLNDSLSNLKVYPRSS
jgi:tRNA(Arg) A34 adenosine deaminase TadA